MYKNKDLNIEHSFWPKFFTMLAIMVVVFSFIYILLSHQLNLNISSSFQIISNYLSVIIGLPITFAGSLVAIMLAHRALLITKNQEHYDNIKMIDEKIKGTFNTHSEINKAMRLFFSDVSNLAHRYFDNLSDNEELSTSDIKELEQKIKISRRNFIESLFKIVDSTTCSSIWRLNKNCSSLFSILNSKLTGESAMKNYTIDNSGSINDMVSLLDVSNNHSNFIHVLTEYYEYEVDADEFNENFYYVATSDHIVNRDKNITTPLLEDKENLLQPWDLILLAGAILCTKKTSVEHWNGDDQTPPELIDTEEINLGAAIICDYILRNPKSQQVILQTTEEISHIMEVNNSISIHIERIAQEINFNQLQPNIWKASAKYIHDNDFLLLNSIHYYFERETNFSFWYFEHPVGFEDDL